MDRQFPKLMEPIMIGRTKIKNRIVFPPMNTNLTSPEGLVTPQLIDYYERRARGGVGMIILEAASIDPNSRNHPGQPMLCDRRSISGWAYLTERLHRYDVFVSVELVHYGSEASIPPRVSPSGITKNTDDPGEVLTIEKMKEIRHWFAMSAKYAKQAGMDAVTLHACHGYLLAEFLSPAFNHRTDEYGGSLENRCRFLVETIQECREAVGPHFPIMVRFSANEFLQDGNSMEDSVKIARILEENGVAAIDISAGQPSAYLMTTPPYNLSQGSGLLVPYSEAIKKAVKVPVFTAIGIREPEQAEKILKEGKADFISMGREQLADPEYANKVREGRIDDIRYCLSCEYCLDCLDDDRRICCAVNPETGREDEFDGIARADVKKKVVVIGGGPGGMEAARVAALRGHEVILIEQRSELGGTLNAAKVPPNKERIDDLVEWYKGQIARSDIQVMLNTVATPELIGELKPDVVLAAVGSHYLQRIPGSDGKNVMNAYDALTQPEKVGGRIVIIGGGASGAETAEYFSGAGVVLSVKGAKKVGGEVEYIRTGSRSGSGKEIDIVEMLPEVCADMDVFCKDLQINALEANGVRLHASCRVERICPDRVIVHNLLTDQDEEFPADTVILAGGLASNEYASLEEACPQVIPIGDAIRPGKIHAAVYTAYIPARNL